MWVAERNVTPASGIRPGSAGRRVLVTGEFNALNWDFVPAVVRFNPDGTLDGSFHVSLVPAPESAYEYPASFGFAANGQILWWHVRQPGWKRSVPDALEHEGSWNYRSVPESTVAAPQLCARQSPLGGPILSAANSPASTASHAAISRV